MLKYLFSIIIIVAFDLTGACQNELRPSKLKERAESAEIEGDAYTAIYYYELLQEDKPKLSTLDKLAPLYLQSRDYEKAKNTYLKIVHSSRNKSLIYLQIGIVYKQLGQYDSCIYYFDKCNKKQLNELKKSILKRELRGAKIALETPIDTSIIFTNPYNLSINTAHMESAPFFINDSLIIYASQGVNENNLYAYNDTNTIPSTKLFYAQKVLQDWIKTKELVEINSHFSNAGNGYISLDKKHLYFTNTIKNWHKKNITQLYVSEYNNGVINHPYKLGMGINDMFFSSSQPTIGTTFNANLEVVYYSTNRPGGKGGMDIWYTVYNKKRGTYGQPINAGSRINTAMDEISPFYDFTTKTLYYSSKGHVGFGGFDIYKSIGELKSWTKPENIGNYLNSNADEIYFRLNPSRTAGFIVTNKPSNVSDNSNYCCFDLSYFTYKNPDQLLLKGTLLAKINPIIDKLLKSGIEFRDSTFMKKPYLKDAVVSLYLKTEMGSDSLYITSDTSDNNGTFIFNADSDQDYTLIIEENNEIKTQIEVSTKGSNNSNNKEIILDIEPIEALPDVPLVIKNIYYEFGSSELSIDARNILDETLIELLKELPNIKIEISSYTDDVGKAEYNLKLSDERAENVAKYLIGSGISKDRLATKGYGETDPIVSNKNEDGSDNPKGRERNRRTEFKIINKQYQAIEF